MMSKVRNKDSKAEVALRKELWHCGYRYRLHVCDLRAGPDLVFPSARAAVFVDGDFWHGRTLVEEGREALEATIRASVSPSISCAG